MARSIKMASRLGAAPSGLIFGESAARLVPGLWYVYLQKWHFRQGSHLQPGGSKPPALIV
jgi:hypothetical protein